MLDGIIVAYDVQISNVAVSYDSVSDDPVSFSIACFATNGFTATPETPLSTR